MRSRHSLPVVLGVIAAVALGSQLTDQSGLDARSPDPTMSRTAAGPETTMPAHAPTASPTASAAALDVVQQAAVAGVTAWQDRDATARNAALAQVATAAFAAALQAVDPAVVPTCAINEVRTDVESDGLARVAVICDTGLVLDVDVTFADAEWRVADIIPGA